MDWKIKSNYKKNDYNDNNFPYHFASSLPLVAK